MEISYQKKRDILDNFNHIRDMVNHLLWTLKEERREELDLNSMECDLKHTQGCVEELAEELKKVFFEDDGKKTELS